MVDLVAKFARLGNHQILPVTWSTEAANLTAENWDRMLADFLHYFDRHGSNID